MLFLGLGTGLGSALVIEGVLAPMELAHLPYKKGKTYEDFVGERGLKRLGRKKWTEAVHDVVAQLKHGLQCDYVVLGGGQTKRLKKLPRGVRLGNNAHAILGGVRLWDDKSERRARRRTARPRPCARRLRRRRRPRPRPAAGSASGDAEGEAEVPSAS